MTREELDVKKQLVMEFMASKSYKPMSVKEMAVVLMVPPKQKKDLRKVVEELSNEGKILVNSKGKISIMPDNARIGKYMGTQRGFGFVRVEGEDSDIYIPGHHSKGAVDGDTVRVSIDSQKPGRKREGTVTAIIERGTSIVVGTYSKSAGFGFVVADNQKFGKDIYIAKSDSKGAITGHKVVVEITDYGSGDRNPEGRITEIIGHINDPGTDILSIVKAYGLPEEYPEAAMAQAESTSENVSVDEMQGRTDYRHLQTVTIDGEDAKDLDDAITLSKEGDIYKLGVHIADVSHYVTENSPLDKEALKRGTSVYLVDRVIPMLPHKLSNGICSLNEGTDRLTLSCMMDINQAGEIINHKIEETVINVDRRMSYTSVNKIIELGDTEEREKYKEFIPMFGLMYELAGILRAKRFKKGSIDFDFPESKITLDKKGRPIEIKEYERNQANGIIEEFMLAANRTVAEEYFWQELPFVYRVHEKPDSEKILQLGIFVNNFGYIIKTGSNDEIHPKEIQKLIDKVKGKPEEALISRLALRSMKQAKYSVNCEGHFGLAMKYYCHFTSPIRRYPDLQIHRIIKENLHGELIDKRTGHYNKILPEVAEASSRLERRAEEAEREVVKFKKAEYMEQFIGESFDGIISGVTSWGMYVELPNTVEGMVRVADIPGDYYYFDEEHYSMTGEHTGRTYKLGNKIRITVAAVDKLLRTIDFVIADESAGSKTAGIQAGQDTDRLDTDIMADKKALKKRKRKKKKLSAPEKEAQKTTGTKNKDREKKAPVKEKGISCDTAVVDSTDTGKSTHIEKSMDAGKGILSGNMGRKPGTASAQGMVSGRGVKTRRILRKPSRKHRKHNIKQTVMFIKKEKKQTAGSQGKIKLPGWPGNRNGLGITAKKTNLRSVPGFTGKVVVNKGKSNRRRQKLVPPAAGKRQGTVNAKHMAGRKPYARKILVQNKKYKGIKRIWRRKQKN